MGFLDDLGKKVSDAGQKTLQKTKEISDVARINASIAEEEKKINNTYYQIGKLYISVYANDYNDEFLGMVNAVTESEQRIKDYRSQIQSIKGVQRCEKCGAEVEKGFAFCNVCGAPMPKATEEENIGDCIKCENCGAFVKREMRFCTSCGKPLMQTSEIAEKLQLLPDEKKVRNCPNCGAELADDSVFCSECGSRV